MNKKVQYFLGSICLLAFLSLFLGVIVNAGWIRILDITGFKFVEPITNTKTRILTELTYLGDPVTIGLITIGLMLLLWRKQCQTDSVWYGMLQFIGYCIVIWIKYGFARIRPTHRLIDVGGYSFPSGHTFSTTIFIFTLLAITLPILKNSWQKGAMIVIACSWIILIMYSRIYLRAHFTSDVLGGLLLACSWWLIINLQRSHFFNWLWKPIIKQFKNKAES